LQIRHISVERLKDEMDKLFKGGHPLKAFQAFQESGLSAYLPLFPNDMKKLHRLVPFNSVLEGWACLMLAGNFTPSEIARAYKLSNIEKSFLASVHKAVEKRSIQPFTVDDYY